MSSSLPSVLLALVALCLCALPSVQAEGQISSVSRYLGLKTSILFGNDTIKQRNFSSPLPTPRVIDLSKPGLTCGPGSPVKDMYMLQNTAGSLELYKPNGEKYYTTIWGYTDVNDATTVTFPSPTILTRPNCEVRIRWWNLLPSTHPLPIDPEINCMTSSDPALTGDTVSRPCRSKLGKQVRTVVHMHGGHTQPDSDGYATRWYTNSNAMDFGQGADVGSAMTSNGILYTYELTQEEATLFYHDHAMGITRYNIWMGLVGMWLIDSGASGFMASNNVPHNFNPAFAEKYDIPLVITDRHFIKVGTTKAEFHFPISLTNADTGRMPASSSMPETLGDTMLVNGVAYPFKNVQPTQYRFRLLNGCDSRFLDLHIENAANELEHLPFWVVAADQGAVLTPDLLQGEDLLSIGPGERYEIVIDFSQVPVGSKWVMRNSAETVDGAPEDPSTWIMQFVVATTAAAMQSFKTSAMGAKYDVAATWPARTGPPGFATLENDATITRRVVLTERTQVTSTGAGKPQPMLGSKNAVFGVPGFRWEDPVTEIIEEDTVELWEIINISNDFHPIHLHLVHFKVLENSAVGFSNYFFKTPNQPMRIFGRDPTPPDPRNSGPKDITVVDPGTRTVVAARWDKAGDYMWHCHIISHEDNVMMRPIRINYKVGNGKCSFLAGENYTVSPLDCAGVCGDGVCDPSESPCTCKLDCPLPNLVVNPSLINPNATSPPQKYAFSQVKSGTATSPIPNWYMDINPPSGANNNFYNWNFFQAAPSRVPTSPQTFSAALVNITSGTNNGNWDGKWMHTPIAVTAGKSYDVVFWMKWTPATATRTLTSSGGSVEINMRYTNALPSSTTTPKEAWTEEKWPLGFNDFNLRKGQWQRIPITITVPASATPTGSSTSFTPKYAQVAVLLTAAGELVVDDYEFRGC